MKIPDLFLVRFRRNRHEYMGDNTRSTRGELEWRLVYAKNEYDAEDKIRKALEQDDPYGTSVAVVDVDVFPAIE